MDVFMSSPQKFKVKWDMISEIEFSFQTKIICILCIINVYIYIEKYIDIQINI